MPTREEMALKYMFQSNAERSLRKQVKRNRRPDDVRRRDWTKYELEDPDTFYALDVPDEERVMPRGERERRRSNWAAAVAAAEPEEREPDAETGQDAAAAPAEDVAPGKNGHIHAGDDGAGRAQAAVSAVGHFRGLVVEVSSGLCRVELPGHTLVCSLRGSLTAVEAGYTNVVAVGDQVIITTGGADQGMVEQVLPRRSALTRPDVSYPHLKQVIAANVDQLLIVAAWREPAFWPELVDRYLITADRSGLEPIICVNKIDLAEDLAACRAALRPYQRVGYRVIFASTVNLAGIDELRRVLQGKSTVLAGLSGVGKSSLLAAAQPGLQLRTHEVSERKHEGRHTTTQASLHKLDGDGRVVDTPGIREFGLAGLRRRDLARFYREFEPVAPHCRFDDCAHLDDPGCAVRAVVRAGWIAGMRYDSYKKIWESLPA